ncbi:MAG: DJ-1/PfpI family protein, partial [Candidatus Omnitrophica bacterium]|nr:DJ-1/PfpI family protein [Candidatus Omnitrophota bacterium]
SYRDEEFEEPKKILASSGAEVVVASSSLKEARGTLGGKVKPDILVGDIKVDDFDCIIFVGGSGSSEYWNNPTAQKIAKEAYTSGKIVAAICIAPVTLANAGLLENKRATVYSSEIERLKNKGAIYTGKGVEMDGNIITANGPDNAKKFADVLVEKLSGK